MWKDVMSMMRQSIERYWHEIADLANGMPASTIGGVAETLLDCHRRGGTIYFIGNGGSAATASHWVCDLAKGVRGGRQPSFRAISLTDNMPLVTAWGNDTSYERVFAEQLAPLARPGDLVVLISASGNSPNMLLAAQTARVARAATIALTGRSGGRLRNLVDLNVRVPSDVIEQVEDVHVMIAHSVCVALRERLESESFPSDNLLDIGVDQVLDEVAGGAGS
jgi:D-sedoheptulose 7-phosphate isomerase